MTNDIVRVVKKSDIQLLDRMIDEIQNGNYDPKKHKDILDILKIKKGWSKDGVAFLKATNEKDKNDIDREKLILEREKFEYKKLRGSLRVLPKDIEDEDGYFQGVEGLVHIKQLIKQYNESTDKNPRHMPTHKELEENGLNKVALAIIDYHEGFQVVAKKLEFDLDK